MASLLLCLLLAGCGQKGDLYLPGGSQTLASGSG
jgi:predicted small lipoprotein YifL